MSFEISTLPKAFLSCNLEIHFGPTRTHTHGHSRSHLYQVAKGEIRTRKTSAAGGHLCHAAVGFLNDRRRRLNGPCWRHTERRSHFLASLNYRLVREHLWPSRSLASALLGGVKSSELGGPTFCLSLVARELSCVTLRGQCGGHMDGRW